MSLITDWGNQPSATPSQVDIRALFRVGRLDSTAIMCERHDELGMFYDVSQPAPAATALEDDPLFPIKPVVPDSLIEDEETYALLAAEARERLTQLVQNMEDTDFVSSNSWM